MADIRLEDPATLVDLRRRLVEFAREIPAIVAGAQREADETRQILSEREAHWEREVERSRQEVERCESALRNCRGRAKKDKNDGGCGGEERALKDARRKLAFAEEQLAKVRSLIRMVDGQRAQFESRARVMRHVVVDVTPRAQARLDALHRAALLFLAESLSAGTVQALGSNPLTGMAPLAALIPGLGSPGSEIGGLAAKPILGNREGGVPGAIKTRVAALQSDWAHLTAEERLARLTEIELAVAAATGRPPVPVVAEDVGSDAGTYNQESRKIKISSLDLGDSRMCATAVDSILHEGRHAYQHYAINHPGFHPDAAAVDVWRHDFAVTGEDWQTARKRAFEADARGFARQVFTELGITLPEWTAEP